MIGAVGISERMTGACQSRKWEPRWILGCVRGRMSPHGTQKVMFSPCMRSQWGRGLLLGRWARLQRPDGPVCQHALDADCGKRAACASRPGGVNRAGQPMRMQDGCRSSRSRRAVCRVGAAERTMWQGGRLCGPSSCHSPLAGPSASAASHAASQQDSRPLTPSVLASAGGRAGALAARRRAKAGWRWFGVPRAPVPFFPVGRSTEIVCRRWGRLGFAKLGYPRLESGEMTCGEWRAEGPKGDSSSKGRRARHRESGAVGVVRSPPLWCTICEA